MLGNAINILLKHFEKELSEKSSLTTLICGENGLVHSLENVFHFGFKSYKLFKKLYIWDFLGKASEFWQILDGLDKNPLAFVFCFF
jgi:hypothetical protein